MGNSQANPQSFDIGSASCAHGFVALFPSGEVAAMTALLLLSRHAACDFGDVCPEDQSSNHQSLLTKRMVMSSYQVPQPNGLPEKVWVITDPGHATTTVLLPSEY